MSVNDELPADNQVVATLLEQSLGLYHKVLLVEDEDGEILFWRETTSFVAEPSESSVFGPFENAAAAIYGINLL